MPVVRLLAALAAGSALAATDPPPAGDPLPPGAVARLGTARYRVAGFDPRVFFTPDPDTLAVTGSGDRVRFLDVPTGRTVGELVLPGAAVREAAASAAGDRLAVLGTYTRVKGRSKGHPAVWLIDPAARRVLWRGDLPEAERAMTWRVRVAAGGKRVATAIDGDLRVWDADSGEELARYAANRRAEVFDLSADGAAVVFGDRGLSLWRWETEADPREFPAVPEVPGRVARFAPDGRTLLVHDPAAPALETWDVAAGRKTAGRPLARFATTFAVRPDGAAAAVADGDDSRAPRAERAVELFDAAGKTLGRLPVGIDPAAALGWSADGRRVAAVTDHRVHVWDAATLRPLGAAPAGHEGFVYEQVLAADGTLFTAGGDGTVRMWDAAGRPGRVFRAGAAVRGLAVAPDAAAVAGFDTDGTLWAWDATTGAERWRAAHGGRFGGTRRVAFSADGGRVFSWADDLVLRATDARTGRPAAAYPLAPPGPADPHRAFGIAETGAFGPDGAAFAVATEAGVRVVDTRTGDVRQTLDTGNGSGGRLAFSPDGRRLAVATPGKVFETRVNGAVPPGGITFADEHEVAAWDVADGKKVWATTTAGHWPARLGFSPDGAWVVEAAADAGPPPGLRLWDAATGRGAGRLALPARPGAFAFDRPGRRVAVAFADTTAVVFDAAAARTPPPAAP